MRTLIYSSNGSPFARKVRIVLHEMGLDYEADIRPGIRPVEELQPLNPGLTLPVMKDGDELLFGSDIIIEFLFSRYRHRKPSAVVPLAAALTRPDMHFQDMKILSVIATFADTLVTVRHYRSEGMTSANSHYMSRQEARLESCLDWLEEQATEEGFWPGVFSMMDIALICPLDYGESRGVLHWRTRPKLAALHGYWQRRPSVAATAEAPMAIQPAV